ncbi:sulfotransferase [Oceanibaculum indicum]|uniref:Sulfotransferase family protein n=1 Tax=Oceanibaculum indicum TaxID=526216 RepID=A0A420WB10_9PROT|nr:sulfotransferase [Oceanibaculum indicum]RKQ68130.1 sulfotransferase family protein [Oceanibaculum indicum]
MTASASGPVLIGATGGSGTRAIREALVAAGFFMGTTVNHAGDLRHAPPVLDRLINPVLERTGSLDYRLEDLSNALVATGLEGLRGVAAKVLEEGSQPSLWGWKNPRLMFVLPFLAEALPDLRFIHVVRDGRDIALSDNRQQIDRHFAARHGHAAPQEPDALALAAIRFWSETNLEALACGEALLGERYHLLRLEDATAPDSPALAELLRLLRPDIDAASLAAAQQAVAHRPGHGRWRDLPADSLAALEEAGRPGLARFGYL